VLADSGENEQLPQGQADPEVLLKRGGRQTTLGCCLLEVDPTLVARELEETVHGSSGFGGGDPAEHVSHPGGDVT